LALAEAARRPMAAAASPPTTAALARIAVIFVVDKPQSCLDDREPVNPLEVLDTLLLPLS